MADRPGKSEPLAELRDVVLAAAAELAEASDRPELTRPPRADLGDYSSNAAMVMAGPLRSSPREVAGELGPRIEGALGESLARLEIAGPGFINLHLSDAWYREALGELMAAMRAASADPANAATAGEGSSPASGDDPLFGLGPVPTASPLRVLVEFVSANPTGPLTAASGRHAAYGDSVYRLLRAAGHEVEGEYYVNDTGGQIDRFAASIAAAMTGDPPPADGYKGAYIERLAELLASEPVDPADRDQVGRAGVAEMLEWIGATLDRFGVHHDSWASERELHEGGAVQAALDRLAAAGHTYESEGALWLRTTAFGDDKDRVLVRSEGDPTYFAADVAYHAAKLERGYDLLIDVLGADHHGYIGRMRAAVEALGADPARFEAPIMQLVSILEGGERAQMSKRSGDFVSLEELISEIGTDAARFMLLHRNHETPVDLDLELARRQSSDNPVYYVQYAHARISSILRKAASEGALPGVEPAGGQGSAGTGSPGLADASAGADGDTLSDVALVEAAVLALDSEALEVGGGAPALEPAERALVKRLLELPDEVREAAARRAPQRICAYATAIAADFHAFYRDCQVVGAEGGAQESRLALCLATKRTLAATLGLLGTSAPERM